MIINRDEADRRVPRVSGSREGDGEGLPLLLVGPRSGPSPSRREGGEERKGVGRAGGPGEEKEGEGMGPSCPRNTSSLFHFPEFHSKLFE